MDERIKRLWETRMDERIKKLWVEELRAHPEKQGMGCLARDGHKRCCLGVLCDIYQREHPDIECWTPRLDYAMFLGKTFTLPSEVMEWAGLQSSDPPIKRKFSSSTLSMTNDSGASFGEIAAIIEEQL